MSSEVQLIVEVWDLVRDTLPPSRRLDSAIQLLRAFEEYGFDPENLKDLLDEDRYLQRAYEDLYEEYAHLETDDDEIE
jgi:hypothetical protein